MARDVFRNPVLPGNLKLYHRLTGSFPVDLSAYISRRHPAFTYPLLKHGFTVNVLVNGLVSIR
jgi:hypothetical protein